VLVVKAPLGEYQKTDCFDLPIGRMAARSFLDTESTRVRGSFATSQSASVVPRKRNGDAPGPGASTRVTVVSLTPAEFAEIPVCTGKRPDIVAEWPGAVSVIAWS
jgi:hypothetical protein